MNIELESRKDMSNHYLTVKKNTNNNINYGLMMLQNNHIRGLLTLEVRQIDDQTIYYYDITSKQPITVRYEKRNLTYKQIQNTMLGILDAIQLSREYLLEENDFLLDPEYIYLGIPNNEVYLCHIIGYEKDIKKQLAGLLEYLMNKIDYIDEKAVVLTYGLYKLSNEDNCTFEKLYHLLQKKESIENDQKIDHSTVQTFNQNMDHSTAQNMDQNIDKIGFTESLDYKECKIEKERIKGEVKNQTRIEKGKNEKDLRLHDKKTESESKKEKQNHKNKNIPLMDEKIESEEEISVLSYKTKLLIILSVILILTLFLLLWKIEVLYNHFGDIDLSKIFGLFVITGSLEAYILSILLSKNNRITKVVPKIEYINPNLLQEETYMDNEGTELKQTNNPFEYYTKTNNNGIDTKIENIQATEQLNDFDIEKTALLSTLSTQQQFQLCSLEPEKFEDITLIEFPFFIGKLKTKVDYVIENNTISRFHARIEKGKNQFFISDLNTTNGTYVNGNKLRANEKAEIFKGDIIMFADIKYRFEEGKEAQDKEEKI